MPKVSPKASIAPPEVPSIRAGEQVVDAVLPQFGQIGIGDTLRQHRDDMVAEDIVLAVVNLPVRSPAGKSNVTAEPVLNLPSLMMVRDAVLAGVGAGRLPISPVSHDLAADRLVLWGDLDRPEIALWTLYPSRRLLSARVSALLNHLKEAFPMGTADELAAHISG